MITAKAFAGEHYAVLGLARSGMATVAALLASGARVTAWDDDEGARAKLLPVYGEVAAQLTEGVAHVAPPLHHVSLVPLPVYGEDLEIADFTSSDLTIFDSIVVTPGLPLNRHPITQRAKDAGVEIIGDIELFARARAELPPHKVVGITGTNGKSTTTALVHHILQTAGVPSLMGGNIGLPILSQEPLLEGGVYVLELSSFQIDLTKSLDCDVAVLLNITPDHLDRYENFEAYAASKARLFEMQSPQNHALFVVDDEKSQSLFKSLFQEREPKSLWQEFRHGMPNMLAVYGNDLQGEELWNGLDPNKKWRTDIPDQSEFPSLQGSHNSQNAVAAFVTCDMVGITDDLIELGLRTYPGLPHRMERITERDGVLFVNDSKATNAEAAAPALAAYPKVRWIVGGQAKAETLGDTAKHLDHVVAAYTIGEAGPMFARLLRDAGVTVVECETLDHAVRRAAEDSQPGETVLLSPASASFDQFRDFEERGDRFRDLVGAL